MPGGVAQLVTGSGTVMGESLKKTCLVDGVGFTGSTAVGKTLMEGGGAHLQHVFLELGGNDPYVVFDSADMDVAVSQGGHRRQDLERGTDMLCQQAFLGAEQHPSSIHRTSGTGIA